MSDVEPQARLPKVIHPFLVPLIPLLQIVQYVYVAKLPVWDFVLCAVVLYLAIIMVFYLISHTLGDRLKGGILTTIIFVPLIGYIYLIYGSLNYLHIMFRHRTVVFIVCWMLVIVYIWKSRRSFIRTTIFLNLLVIILVLLNIYAGTMGIKNLIIVQRGFDLVLKEAQAPIKSDTLKASPDIFYIITDAHTRADSLQKYWHYNELPFIEALQAQGFYIALESNSNYNSTLPSIASALTMQYLPKWNTALDLKINTRAYLAKELINNNKVTNLLASKGYEINNLSLLKLKGSEEFYPSTNFWSKIKSVRSVLFENSMAFPIARLFRLVPFPIVMTDINLNIIRKLRESLSKPRKRPRFTYVHLMLPHPPYVFDSKGNITDWNSSPLGGVDEKEKYLQQLMFTDQLLTQITQEILSNSPAPPVIILQGDHGSRELQGGDKEIENYTILNAYFLPAGGENLLYSSISPVNTFRVVLNHYIGTNFDLLPDKSVYGGAGLLVDD